MAQAAFAHEILPHVSSLKRAARRFGLDADDLVQETLLRALVAEERYRLGSNAGGWLQRILHNVAVSEHRRLRRHAHFVDRLSSEPSSSDNAAPPPRTDTAGLAAALAELPAADRAVVELCDIGGLRYREAAVALDCPIGTVMSRLHRARRRLAATLNPRSR
jgi:RNA polymerase sigma-70 factor (ECF subfamily)